MAMNLFKSILHNVGVVLVGLGVALLGRKIDSLLGVSGFHSTTAAAIGFFLLGAGFILRVWATFHFYENQMRVISLAPQKKLITSGPYRFSRNPLYLGGNVFIFFGAHPPRGTAAGEGLWRRLAALQESGAQMDLTRYCSWKVGDEDDGDGVSFRWPSFARRGFPDNLRPRGETGGTQ
jgi:hypothetical protein